MSENETAVADVTITLVTGQTLTVSSRDARSFKFNTGAHVSDNASRTNEYFSLNLEMKDGVHLTWQDTLPASPELAALMEKDTISAADLGAFVVGNTQ